MNLNNLYEKIKNMEVKDTKIKDEILKEIEIEILTNGKVNKGIISIFKKIQKDNKNRPIFQGIYKTVNDNYCITDGACLLDFGKTTEYIPKEIMPFINTENTNNKIDYETMNNQNANIEIMINITELEKIAKYNKLHKEQPILLPIQNKLFNAEKLLDFVRLSGNKKIEKLQCFSDDKLKTPINFNLNNIKGIILPVTNTIETYIENQKLYEQNIKNI